MNGDKQQDTQSDRAFDGVQQPTVQPSQAQTVGSFEQQAQHQPVAPVVGAIASAPPQKPRRRISRSRLVFLASLGLTLLVLGGGAGAYFGYFAPNKPENIWQTALKRTADGYDRLVTYAEADGQLSSGTFAGTVKATGYLTADGSVKGSFDKNNSLITGDLGLAGSRVSAEIRAIDAPNSSNPDVYIKAQGLKGLDGVLGDWGLDGLAKDFENQWVVIDHTLFDGIADQALTAAGSAAKPEASTQLTNEEIVQIAQAVGTVNRQYLFTTDPAKSITKVTQQVGKETQDNRSVYHYKIGLNKSNTKSYLDELVRALDATPVKKLLSGQSIGEALSVAELRAQVDGMSDSATADVYVDMRTKTLRTIKFTDTRNSANVLELKMPITDRDTIPFVIKAVTNEDGYKTEYEASVTANLKSRAYDLALGFRTTGVDPAESQSLNATLRVTPSKEALRIEKPTGAKTFGELLGATNADELFADESADVLGVSFWRKDTAKN